MRNSFREHLVHNVSEIVLRPAQALINALQLCQFRFQIFEFHLSHFTNELFLLFVKSLRISLSKIYFWWGGAVSIILCKFFKQLKLHNKLGCLVIRLSCFELVLKRLLVARVFEEKLRIIDVKRQA